VPTWDPQLDENRVPHLTRRVFQPPHQISGNDERGHRLKQIHAHRIADRTAHGIEAEVAAARMRMRGVIEVDGGDVLDDRPAAEIVAQSRVCRDRVSAVGNVQPTPDASRNREPGFAEENFQLVLDFSDAKR
jgi:hypothetical protein